MAGDSVTERVTAPRRMLALLLAETERHQLQEAKSNRKIRVSLAKRWEAPIPNRNASQETNIPPSPPRFRPQSGARLPAPLSSPRWRISAAPARDSRVSKPQFRGIVMM